MIPETSQYTPLDKLFSLFTKLRPGEGRCLFLLFWLGFAFMYCQWVLKPVRDALILSEADAEMAAYGNAVQAVILMIMIPLYGFLYRRLSKIGLVQAVTLFFVATTLLFYVLYEAGVKIYFPFYVWAGIYGTMMIAQFWALAADHFNVKSGQRLFGVLAAGVSLDDTEPLTKVQEAAVEVVKVWLNKPTIALAVYGICVVLFVAGSLLFPDRHDVTASEVTT